MLARAPATEGCAHLLPVEVRAGHRDVVGNRHQDRAGTADQATTTDKKESCGGGDRRNPSAGHARQPPHPPILSRTHAPRPQRSYAEVSGSVADPPKADAGSRLRFRRRRAGSRALKITKPDDVETGTQWGFTDRGGAGLVRERRHHTGVGGSSHRLQRLNCQGSCRCADGGVRQFFRWSRSSWGAGWSGGCCLVVRRVADGFPLAAGLAAAQGDGGVGAADGPSHARRFRALSDDRFAACFVGSGADEKATGAEVLVAHAGRVVLEVAQCPCPARFS